MIELKKTNKQWNQKHLLQGRVTVDLWNKTGAFKSDIYTLFFPQASYSLSLYKAVTLISSNIDLTSSLTVLKHKQLEEDEVSLCQKEAHPANGCFYCWLTTCWKMLWINSFVYENELKRKKILIYNILEHFFWRDHFWSRGSRKDGILRFYRGLTFLGSRLYF